MEKIKQMLAEFDEYKVFHVIRKSNVVADAQANKVVFFLQVIIKIKEREFIDPIS